MTDWVVCTPWRRKMLLFLSLSGIESHFLRAAYPSLSLYQLHSPCFSKIRVEIISFTFYAVYHLGFVSGCRLEGTGIESLQKPEKFPCSKTSRPALYPNQPPVCSVPGHEDDHTRLSSAEDNEWHLRLPTGHMTSCLEKGQLQQFTV